MARIYVAGKNLDRARAVMERLQAMGHIITFDWVGDIENDSNQEQKAREEREAVRSADLLVYLWEANQESARYEAGMAMGLGKPIIISGAAREYFFLTLPEIIHVSSDDQIFSVKLLV